MVRKTTNREASAPTGVPSQNFLKTSETIPMTRVQPSWITALSFLLLCLTSLSAYAAARIEVHEPWVREAPPNVKVLAAYLTVHNHSSKTMTLKAISSPDFGQVEMHRTEQQDGMTRMVAVKQVMLSPNGSVAFAPGGMHVMLMQPKKGFRAGDKIHLTLSFSDGSSVQVVAPVKKAMSGHDMMMDHDMNHHDHDQQHDSQHQH
jgi:hypothetical protein